MMEGFEGWKLVSPYPPFGRFENPICDFPQEEFSRTDKTLQKLYFFRRYTFIIPAISILSRPGQWVSKLTDSGTVI